MFITNGCFMTHSCFFGLPGCESQPQQPLNNASRLWRTFTTAIMHFSAASALASAASKVAFILLFWSFVLQTESRPQNEYQLPGLASQYDLEAEIEAASGEAGDNCWSLLDQTSWPQVISFDEKTSTIRINFQHTKSVPPSPPNKVTTCLKGMCTASASPWPRPCHRETKIGLKGPN